MLHKEPALLGKTLPSMYLTITGGGTGIIPRLLEQGGASSYFVGADIPYSNDLTQQAWSSLFGNFPVKACSKEMAQFLAFLGENKMKMPGYQQNLLSIGVTASLMKAEGERPDRLNEAYVCFNFNGSERNYHWVFDKTFEVENLYCSPSRWKENVSRAMQENLLVDKLYSALVEILSE